jgi:hypothetical protein
VHRFDDYVSAVVP